MFGTDTPLHSLLIKPVQRIAKYPLLMKVTHCLAKIANYCILNRILQRMLLLASCSNYDIIMTSSPNYRAVM